MGQPIEVTATVLGEVALLVGDRTITGQDGAGFSSAAEARETGGLAGRLAEALFDTDPGISHVFTHSNVASVTREGGWADGEVDALADVLRHFFVYYGREHGSEEQPVGGAGAGLTLAPAAPFDPEVAAALRREHYNATITEIDVVHDKLWIMRVRPDGEFPEYAAGQYGTLGVGFWEPRIDHRREVMDPDRFAALARRSYSISSSILGPDGELLDPAAETALEFYVVLVEADWRDTPAVLTPRLFLMEEGDRIQLGRKMAGRTRATSRKAPAMASAQTPKLPPSSRGHSPMTAKTTAKTTPKPRSEPILMSPCFSVSIIGRGSTNQERRSAVL